ncbi:hypothetical protein JavanS250_0008 [Streptococcus satellite phage Javan250]|uniref:hypothetical protein n=1 Tax=Streptococcus halotolerans TaxID=1814128 RepID=UPI0007891B48|nr:hypothetical protein [Streptococcus halotolerans]QBX08341.1 hypothetical protein JavanS250_0008 [Streptococcus satellite phage Javan250]
MRYIDIMIAPDWVKDFRGLDGVKTRLLYKQGYCIMTYFEPTDCYFENLGKDGVQISVSETDNIDTYLTNNWQSVHDMTPTYLSGKVLDFVNALQIATVKADRNGYGLSLTGIVDRAFAYGISTKDEMISFIRRCYRDGVDQEKVYLYLTTALRTTSLNAFLLDEVNKYYREGATA